MRDWLRGKKTYLVAAAGIIAALASWSSGDIDTAKLIESVWGAVLAVTIRAGITNGR